MLSDHESVDADASSEEEIPSHQPTIDGADSPANLDISDDVLLDHLRQALG